MKTIVIIATILIVMLMSAQALLSRSTGKTEQQQYEVLEKDENFEIRYYPPAIVASVKNTGSYDASSGNSFRTLAGYIFGKNKGSVKIAMTSPVRMEQEADTFGMQFVMPSEYSMEDLPEPDDPSIQLKEFEGGYYASVRFGGYANENDWKEKKAELIAILERKGVAHYNHFEYLGYNPPYQFIKRRNEVVVKLTDYQP